MNKNFNHYTPNVIEPNPAAKLHKLFANFNFVKTFKIPSTTQEAFQSYIEESQIYVENDPLQWWKTNFVKFPNITKPAKIFLGIPTTSVSSDDEKTFSTSGWLISKYRAQLKSNLVQEVIFLHYNL